MKEQEKYSYTLEERRNGSILKWLGAVGVIGLVGYLIFAILTAPEKMMSEAQRYFGITIIFFIILVSYIEIVVKRR